VKTHRAQVAGPDSYLLAEGPLWDPVRERVLWVDIESHAVHTGVLADELIRPAERLDFAETVGAVVTAEDGTLLVAGRRELITVAPSGERTARGRILAEGVGSRLNDGGCDPAGRFLVGSMALDGRSGAEPLCRVDGEGAGGQAALSTLDTDLTLSNGLAWSPDGRTMYSIDTIPGVVRGRSYDPGTGEHGEPAELFRVEDGGSPDGMCVDADGNLWIAVWGAGQVRCCTPSGEVLAVVEVDAPHTSSVAFVGPDLDLLMITTAKVELTPDELAVKPDSGRLFTARVATTGLPVPFWKNVFSDVNSSDGA
jgi:sugar lactone lactonase YvrE